MLIGQIIVLLIAPIAFLYETQSDLGTTIIIFIGILSVMWLGEVSMRSILLLLGVAFVLALVATFGTGYRTDRLVVYNPWGDGENGYGDGYQTIHSFYAFAEGGIFGVGLGNSREKFDYLPEAETDFVFSIIGEELGMIGALLVIALFLALLFAGLRIARAQTRVRLHGGGKLHHHDRVPGVFEHRLRHRACSHHGQTPAVRVVGRLFAYRHVHHGRTYPVGCQICRHHHGLRSAPREPARRARRRR